MSEDFFAILKPPNLWSRAEVLSRPWPVPRKPGVYAWYFRGIPDRAPIEHPLIHDSNVRSTLAFLSPASPPRSGKLSRTQVLRRRIQMHMRGNVYGPTLRPSLGCLLGNELGIELRRRGGGTRLMFADGERVLHRSSAGLAVHRPKAWRLAKVNSFCFSLS